MPIISLSQLQDFLSGKVASLNDLKGEEPKRSRSEGYCEPHSTGAGAERILRGLGWLDDVDKDGSCGYHASKKVLVKCGFETEDITRSDLREQILTFAKENKTRFIGSKVDGSDSIFRRRKDNTGAYAFGDHAKQAKKNIDPIKCRAKIFDNEITSGIWYDNIDYTRFVTTKHWMDAVYVLPIIAYKYKMECLLLVTSMNSTAGNGGMKFHTSEYCYEASDDCVYFQDHEGLVLEREKKVDGCLVLFKTMNHYMMLDLFEV